MNKKSSLYRRAPNATFMLLILFGITQFLSGQNNYPIRLKSGTIYPEENLQDFISKTTVPVEETFQGYYYRLVQFYQIPDTASFTRMKKSGLIITGCIPNETYCIAIPVDYNKNNLKHFNIRSVTHIRPEYNLSPLLTKDSLPSWALRGAHSIRLNVEYYANLSKEGIFNTLKELGIEVWESKGLHYCVEVEIPILKLSELASLVFVSYIEPISAPEQIHNYKSRSLSRTNTLHSAINQPGYTGKDVVIAMIDDGPIGPHVDISGRFNNNTRVEGVPEQSEEEKGTHGDHVAGTIIGAGVLGPYYTGHAPQAILEVEHMKKIFINYNSFYFNKGVTITSNSYGPPLEGFFQENSVYDGFSREMDLNSQFYPRLNLVFSAGNDGKFYLTKYGFGYNTINGSRNVAKNVITVGNLMQNDLVYETSSRGPTNDGRIKPDICAFGTNVMSTQMNNEYDHMTGTSMAAPAVSGILACLTQAYKEQHYGTIPNSDLLKAIILNSADDIQNPGPDFKSGWGRINARKALIDIQEANYISGPNLIINKEVKSHNIFVPDDIYELKIMVYWHDSVQDERSVPVLVNDIDMTVTDPFGNISRPLVLDHRSTYLGIVYVNNIATQGRDSVNNVEQVVIAAPEDLNTPIPGGNYMITLTGKSINKPPQGYVIAYEFIRNEVILTWPSTGASFASDTTEIIRWDAYDKSTDFDLFYKTPEDNDWKKIEDNIDGKLRCYEWDVPDLASGQVQIKIQQDDLFDISDSFSIIGIPGNLELSCGEFLVNSVRLNWDPVEGATGYKLFRLTENAMESLWETPVTEADIPLDDVYKENWVSVQAIGPYGAVGMRADAIKVPVTIFPEVQLKGAGTNVFCDNLLPQTAELIAETEPCEDCNFTYQWTRNGMVIPYVASNKLTVYESGDYCVLVTKSDGCVVKACGHVEIDLISCSDCSEQQVDEGICDKININIEIIRSYDPNEITGPAGYGSEQFVKKDDDLVYTVFFENDPDFATGPAQKVVINMPFDDKANLQSFRLREFGFGSHVFQVPDNKTFYTQRLDLVDSLGVYVDVVAGVDVNSNKAFWIFQSIDPATGLPPADPMTGFLPVNDTLTGSGEGYVSFRMRPVNNAVTGDTITADASIIFDINEPILTNTWENRIDALPPSSTVDPLPPVINATAFDLTFSGQDDAGGSGIGKYRLYYSENGGPFAVYSEFPYDQAVAFNGEAGKEYGFFSLAIDNVGNTEPMKTTAEATTVLGNLSLQATGIIFSSVDTSNMTFDWTDGSGAKRAVFIRQGTQGTAVPANNSTYTASTIFGEGSQIGSTGWYCVFNGTDHPEGVTVTSLTPGEMYRVMVCEYLGSPGLEQYLTEPADGNPADRKACYQLFAVISGPATACLKEGITLTYDYFTRAGMQNYSWTVSGGGRIQSGNGSHAIEVSWLTPGVSYVSVSFTDPHACEAVSTAQFTVVIDTNTVPGYVSGSALITLGYPTDTLVIEGHHGRVVKWQKKFGSNTFSDIPATNDQVKYIDTPDALGTWYYRTLVQNDSCFAEYSEPAAVEVTDQPIGRTWTGVIDENWHKAGNWSPPGIPRPTEDVIIPSTAPHMPLVRVQGMSCHQIYLSEGATLIINPGMTLVITGEN